MKETHRGPLCYNSRCFGQGYNKKFYNAVCSVIELLSTYSFFTEGKTHIMLDTLFLRDVILTPFVVKNVVYVTISKSITLSFCVFIMKMSDGVYSSLKERKGAGATPNTPYQKVDTLNETCWYGAVFTMADRVLFTCLNVD
jgi:hypothetical protein